MKKETRDPLHGSVGVVLKFLGAALFGCLIPLLLFWASYRIVPETFWYGWWPHLFWIIPVVWGFLGIFWFEQMLRLAKKIFEGTFNIRE